MAHAAYFKHVLVRDVTSMPGNLLSLDDPAGGCRSQIARMPKRSEMTRHSELPGTVLRKCFSGKNHIKLKK